MVSSTDGSGQLTKSAGMNQAVANDMDLRFPRKAYNNNPKVEKGSGEEKGEDLSGNEGRGTCSGSLRFLSTKIKEGQEDNRERRKEEREKRKLDYTNTRKNSIRKDKAMNSVPVTVTRVLEKEEKLVDKESSLAQAIDLTKVEDGEQVNLVIDLTKEAKRKARGGRKKLGPKKGEDKVKQVTPVKTKNKKKPEKQHTLVAQVIINLT